MSKPENYTELSIGQKYSYYASLPDKDIKSFLSNLSKEEKKELHIEGLRLEKEEKEQKIAELVARISPKMEANIAKMLRECEESGKPPFEVRR